MGPRHIGEVMGATVANASDSEGGLIPVIQPPSCDLRLRRPFVFDRPFQPVIEGGTPSALAEYAPMPDIVAIMAQGRCRTC